MSEANDRCFAAAPRRAMPRPPRTQRLKRGREREWVGEFVIQSDRRTDADAAVDCMIVVEYNGCMTIFPNGQRRCAINKRILEL